MVEYNRRMRQQLNRCARPCFLAAVRCVRLLGQCYYLPNAPLIPDPNHAGDGAAEDGRPEIDNPDFHTGASHFGPGSPYRQALGTTLRIAAGMPRTSLGAPPRFSAAYGGPDEEKTAELDGFVGRQAANALRISELPEAIDLSPTLSGEYLYDEYEHAAQHSLYNGSAPREAAAIEAPRLLHAVNNSGLFRRLNRSFGRLSIADLVSAIEQLSTPAKVHDPSIVRLHSLEVVDRWIDLNHGSTLAGGSTGMDAVAAILQASSARALRVSLAPRASSHSSGGSSGMVNFQAYTSDFPRQIYHVGHKSIDSVGFEFEHTLQGVISAGPVGSIIDKVMRFVRCQQSNDYVGLSLLLNGRSSSNKFGKSIALLQQVGWGSLKARAITGLEGAEHLPELMPQLLGHLAMKVIGGEYDSDMSLRTLAYQAIHYDWGLKAHETSKRSLLNFPNALHEARRKAAKRGKAKLTVWREVSDGAAYTCIEHFRGQHAEFASQCLDLFGAAESLAHA